MGMSCFMGFFMAAVTTFLMPWNASAGWSSDWQGSNWQEEAVAATCKWQCYIDSHPGMWNIPGAGKWYRRLRKHWLLNKKKCKCPSAWSSGGTFGQPKNGHDQRSGSKHGHHHNYEVKKLRTKLQEVKTRLQRV